MGGAFRGGPTFEIAQNLEQRVIRRSLWRVASKLPYLNLVSQCVSAKLLGVDNVHSLISINSSSEGIIVIAECLGQNTISYRLLKACQRAVLGVSLTRTVRRIYMDALTRSLQIL